MADGVFHTGYGITIDLNQPDLGSEDRPGLLEEITQPVGLRERTLLECLDYHKDGFCKATEDSDRSPWMTIRRVTRDGRTTLVAAHLPIRQHPTAEESDRHKAMKERIARAAERHGLSAVIEAPTPDKRLRSDVLVTGAAGRIGWEAQYSPITARAVRLRSTAAAERGIVPLWVTNSDKAEVIDRAPWARVDDFSWQEIASPRTLLVRGGVRHLQHWKCKRHSERPCPANGSWCNRYHAQWHLPALCIPQLPHTEVDELVATSADGEYVPLQIPSQDDPHISSRMWVPASDHKTWAEIIGPDDAPAPDEEAPEASLTFSGAPLDGRCRYGEETMVFNDRRVRRDVADATGLHTFDEVPPKLFKVPRDIPRLDITPAQRRTAAALHSCGLWDIGPCAGCGAPIHRYGNGSMHACPKCRSHVNRRAV